MGDTREAVLAFARATRSPTRAQRRRQLVAMAVAALAWTTAVLMLTHTMRLELAPRPPWLVAVTALGAAGLAAASFWIAITRGDTMLGRSKRTLMAVALGIPVVLFLWKIGLHTCVTGTSDPWPGRPGTRCFLIALLSGLGPFVALLWARRGSVTSSAVLAGAAIGATAGTLAWLVNDLRCQVGYFKHVLIGHVAPLVIFILLGAILGRWLVPRWISPSGTS